jgi:hypothetical protein
VTPSRIGDQIPKSDEHNEIVEREE